MYFDFTPEEMRTRGGILDKFMDTAFDAAVLVDQEGRIIHRSSGSMETFKLPEPVVGRPIKEFDPFSPFDQVLQTGKAMMGVMVVIRGRKCMTNLIPIISKGEVIGALGMLLFRNLGTLKRILASLDRAGDDGIRDIYSAIARVDSSQTFEDFVGESKIVREMLEQCRHAARTSYPILITGETGTGKEILASAFHSESLSTSFRPFVKINCTAIPSELMESELFGHEKGAFTGAVSEKKGKFELAAGGSILLDEIGDMDMRLQGKLLRVLEEREYERIGGTKLLPINARIIASTNRDLRDLCEQGKFRPDLYYRLSVIEIGVPPLRAHKEDIPVLLKHLMRGDGVKLAFSPEALELLMHYKWPGNVRELRNVINRLGLSVEKKETSAEDVRRVLSSGMARDEAGEENGYLHRDATRRPKVLELQERECILNALRTNGCNITDSARYLNISRATLYNKIRKHNIILDKRASEST